MSSIVAGFRQQAIKGVRASMAVIRPYQTGAVDLNDIRRKSADQTVVTAADRASEDAATNELRTLGLPILREEAGWLGLKESVRYCVLIDPVDGTLALALGIASCTVIIALYDRRYKQIVCTVIGDPGTGRIWVADATDCTLLVDGRPPKTCRVWEGPFEKGVVLIDLLGEFRAHGGTKLVWDNDGIKRLVSELVGRVKINCFGSNGMHHARGADGSTLGHPSPTGVAGTLTLAMGGPYDCAGALHVVRSGGMAAGFLVTDDRRLVECDPLDPFGYDFLLTAGTGDGFDFLRGAIMRAFG
ncbi:MAG: hypothetical protein JWN01_99 [Patescibacteria group bacterium]|nr:hypothetical protein [Patescibacteria group bacterium]